MFFEDKKEKEIHKKLKTSCEKIKKQTTLITGMIKDLSCEDEVKKKQLNESSEANGKRYSQRSKTIEEWGLNGIIN